MRTIELLRKYCMNDNPVQLQVLSDQARNFSRCAACEGQPARLACSPPGLAPAPRSNSRVNYEDDSYNVGLPVFIIHGASSRGRTRRADSALSVSCALPLLRAGNHDEPAGADNLSAVDILAACNLVNYYGKLVRRAAAVRCVRWSPPPDCHRRCAPPPPPTPSPLRA